MKKLITFFITGIFLFLSSRENTLHTFTLNGVITNRKIDSVKLLFYRNSTNFLPEIVYGKVVAGRFHIVIKEVRDAGQVCIQFLQDGKEWYPQNYDFSLNRGFLFEPGDSVLLNMDNSKTVFYGIGSAKYNCILRVNDKSAEISSHPSPERLDELTYLDYEQKKYDSIYKSAICILDSSDKDLTRESYNILKLNYKSLGPLSVMKSVYSWQVVIDEERYLSDNAAYFNFSAGPAMAIEKSGVYSDFLFMKERVMARLGDTVFKNKAQYFNEVFKRIESNYSGPMRDKLLAMSLSPDIDKDSSDYYLDRANALVENEVYKDIIRREAGMFAKGAKAFNFHLENSNGRMINLSDFTGKVVVLDFYFKGCSGCVKLAKAMKPVIEAFKDNPNVVFVSINTDKSRKMFLDAVASGIYSDKGSVNLYTNGRGMDHELITYYGFDGCPQLMLVDRDGKILSGNPPIPSCNPKSREPDPNDYSVVRLIQIIRDGLKADM